MKMQHHFLLVFLYLISTPLHCSENKTSELKLFKPSENKLKLLTEAMNKYYNETEDLKKEDKNLKNLILLGRVYGNHRASKVLEVSTMQPNPQESVNLLICLYIWCTEKEIDGLLAEDNKITTESDAFVIAIWELFLAEKLSVETAQNIFKMVPTHSDILNKKESHVIKYRELQKAIKCFKDNYKKLGLKI